MTVGKKRNAASAKPRAEIKVRSAGSAAARVEAARHAAFVDENPAHAFAHFRARAAAMPKADLAPFTGQPLVMRANIRKALGAVEPHLERIVEQLPGARIQDVLELPSLVMALDFAVGRVPLAKLSSGEIKAMLDEGAPWRELMLLYLEVVSHPLIGIVSRERVKAIRAGSGLLDRAQDFVAIPGVFAEHEDALHGKHPFPMDKVHLLGTLGAALVQQIKPGSAPVEVAQRSPESILRDQFAALVTERYDHLQVLAAVALGKHEADRALPALRSAVATTVAAGGSATAGDGATAAGAAGA